MKKPNSLFSMQHVKRSSSRHALISLLAILFSVLLINVASEGISTRVDLTTSNIYSLDVASKALVAGLDERIHATAYIGNVPNENAFEQQYVESLLERYSEASNGKLTWEKIDPFERGREFQNQLRDDEQIDKILWFSLVDGVPQQIPIYFQIKFKYLDQSEVWTPPAQFNLNGLEYTFTSLFKRLAYPRKQILVTQGFGSPAEARVILSSLSNNYAVNMVDIASETFSLDPADVLIVNGPTELLSSKALGEIDAYVTSGNPVLFLLRGMKFQPMGQNSKSLIGVPVQTGLENMLKNYGVTLHSEIILDPIQNSLGAAFVGNNGFLTKEPFPLVDIISSQSHGVLAGMKKLVMPYTSRITLNNDQATSAQIKTTLLAQTSDASFFHDKVLTVAQDIPFTPLTEDRGPYSTGYALEGAFPSLTNPSTQGKSTRMIAFGSADFVGDAYVSLAQRSPLFQNLVFGQYALSSMVDWLLDDRTLTSIMSKQAPQPMAVISPSQKAWAKYGAGLGVSFFILLIAVAMHFISDKKRYSIDISTFKTKEK